MKVKVYDNGLDYYVKIYGVWYEMSADADMPNGVCMTIGNWTYEPANLGIKVKKENIPAGIVRQIERIV